MKNDKIMGTRRWLFWFSLGTVLIIIYKFFDNFTGIGKWIGNLFSIIAPFLAAIIISYILYKPCSAIENKLKKKTKLNHTRGISIIVVYTIVIIVLLLILNFIIPALINSVGDLINNIQNYYNSITTNGIHGNWAPFIKDNILKPLVEYIQQMDFKTMITPDKIIEYVSSAIGVVKTIFSVFIAFVCSVYILAARENIIDFIKRFAKASMTQKGFRRFNRYFTSGNEIFFGFISSQFIDAFVVAVLMSITLLILNVKYAVLLGVMIGIFNLIPYFGAILAVVIAGLITVLTGGWQQALIMVVVVTIVQQIDANIINPRITGSKLNVSPLLVIFAVTVGGAYFGIIGMFLAVPIAVLIKLMIEDYIANKNSEKKKAVE